MNPKLTSSPASLRKLLLRSGAQRRRHVSSNGRILSNTFAPAAASYRSHEQHARHRSVALRRQRGTGAPPKTLKSGSRRSFWEGLPSLPCLA